MLKNYRFIEHTVSLCNVCLKRLDAKIIEKSERIYIKKNCPIHGDQIELLEEDASWYLHRKDFDKPGNIHIAQTVINNNCPYDCGLCPNHEQHTCVALIEITNRCDLKCPVCFANSSDGDFISKSEFEKMVDFYLESEGGNAEILQISGGEPSLHPDIIDFIDYARTKGVKYVMLNTNGIRLAQDIQFAKELSRFKGGFEIYLQFDGFKDSTNIFFRGKKLLDLKYRAIENLAKFNIPITLVSTIAKGINDDEIGQIINLGISTNYVRGISFQPIGYFGRIPDINGLERITISGIIQKIEEQTSGMINKSDFIPLPCNVDRVAITYLYKDKKNTFIPLLRNINAKKYLPYIRNTFKFDPDEFFKDLSSDITKTQCCSIPLLLKNVTRFIPLSYINKTEKEKIDFVNENTFRISITSFVDAYNFDIKSLQKECVHFITPELKKIPFSSFNIFNRE